MMPVPNVKMRPRLDKKIQKNWVQRSREKLTLWLYLRWWWGGGGFQRSVEVWNCVGGFSDEGTAYHTVFKVLQYFQIIALFSNYSTVYELLHCFQPIVVFLNRSSFFKLPLQFSNYCSVFRLLQCFQTIAVFSDYCSAFKLLHCFQTIALFSNYCTVFKLVHCSKTIVPHWISVHKGVWRCRCFHSVNSKKPTQSTEQHRWVTLIFTSSPVPVK